MLLAGKYVEEGGPKEAASARVLLKLLQFVGSINRKSVTQVALNYLMCKGDQLHGRPPSHYMQAVVMADAMMSWRA